MLVVHIVVRHIELGEFLIQQRLVAVLLFTKDGAVRCSQMAHGGNGSRVGAYVPTAELSG